MPALARYVLGHSCQSRAVVEHHYNVCKSVDSNGRAGMPTKTLAVCPADQLLDDSTSIQLVQKHSESAEPTSVQDFNSADCPPK